MAKSPPTAPNGTYRVLRVHHIVWEAYVTAGSASAAKTAAKALRPQDWEGRVIKPANGEDIFEYDVIDGNSDNGA